MLCRRLLILPAWKIASFVKTVRAKSGAKIFHENSLTTSMLVLSNYRLSSELMDLLKALRHIRDIYTYLAMI